MQVQYTEIGRGQEIYGVLGTGRGLKNARSAWTRHRIDKQGNWTAGRLTGLVKRGESLQSL